MLPGTTHADPLLQNDALFHARVAMIGLAPKDCKGDYGNRYEVPAVWR